MNWDRSEKVPKQIGGDSCIIHPTLVYIRTLHYWGICSQAVRISWIWWEYSLLISKFQINFSLQKFSAENGEKLLKFLHQPNLSSNITFFVTSQHSKLVLYRLDFLLKAIIWIKVSKTFLNFSEVGAGEQRAHIFNRTWSKQQLRRKLVKRVLTRVGQF